DDIVEVTLDDAGLVSRRRKIAGDGRIRRKQVVIVRTVVVGVLFLFFENTYRRIGDALYRDGRAHSRLSGEELPSRGISQNDDAAPIAFILIGNKPSFPQQQGTEILVSGPQPHHPAIGRVELADFGNRAPQFRAHILHVVALIPNEACIVDGERNLTTRSKSANLGTGASAPHDHQVFAQRLHVFLLVHHEALAQAYQDNHRRDSPDDSKHREEASHLVSPECAQCLAEDFEEVHTFKKKVVGSQRSEVSYGAIKNKVTPDCFFALQNSLLQNDLIAFLQSAQQLSLGAVGDADIHRHLALSTFAFGIRYLDGSFLLVVVNDGAFW